jgi:hypothetical protein
MTTRQLFILPHLIFRRLGMEAYSFEGHAGITGQEVNGARWIWPITLSFLGAWTALFLARLTGSTESIFSREVFGGDGPYVI